MKNAFVLIVLTGLIGVVPELNSQSSALLLEDLSLKDTELLSATPSIACGGGGGGSRRTPEERKKARQEMKTLFEANQRAKAKLAIEKQRNGSELSRWEHKIIKKYGNNNSFN